MKRGGGGGGEIIGKYSSPAYPDAAHYDHRKGVNDRQSFYGFCN